MKKCAWVLQKGFLVLLGWLLLGCHFYLPISRCVIMGEEMTTQQPTPQLPKQTPDAAASVESGDKSQSTEPPSESAEEPVGQRKANNDDDSVQTKTVSTVSSGDEVSASPDQVNETQESVNGTIVDVGAHKSSHSSPVDSSTISTQTADVDKTGESTSADSLFVQSTDSKIPSLPKLELSLKKDVPIKTITIEASKSPVLNEIQSETDTLITLDTIIQTAKGKLQDIPETDGNEVVKSPGTSTLVTDNITVSNETLEMNTFLITPEGENMDMPSIGQVDVSLPTSPEESEGGISNSETTTSEEMPSYNEWAQKKRAEQEKKGGAITTTVTVQDHKGRQKNYASADCGAKIIGTNIEAQGASAVLNAYHDEYMLNPCTAKIWLVIELCEPIQAHKIEIANFELFSSSPREFSVFSSDRYPNREWTNLGTFTANDDKTVQKFILEQQTFHKFIKIEMLSHYGSEHFCPLSLVRIYGISEIEVLDENEVPESRTQDEDTIITEDEKEGTNAHPPNLFVTAKDVVFSIVKQATKALTRDKHSPDSSTSNLTINGTESLENSSLPVNGVQSKDPCVSLNRLLFPRQFSLWLPHSSSVELNHLALEASILQKLYLPNDVELPLTNVTVQEEDTINDSVMHSLSCDYYFLTKLLQQPNVVQILHKCSLTSSDSSRNPSLSSLDNSRLCKYFKVVLGEVRFSALYELYKIQKKQYIPVPYVEIKTKEVANDTQSVIVKETVQSEVVSTKLAESSVSTPTVQKDSDMTTATLVRTPIPMPSQPKETASRGSQVTIQTTLISQSSESLQREIQPTKTSKAESEPEKNFAESQPSSQTAFLQPDSVLPLSVEDGQNSTLAEAPNSSEIESSVSSPIIESVSISGDISQDSVESKVTSPTLTESVASSSNILSTAAGDKFLAEGSVDKSCSDAVLVSDTLIDDAGMASAQSSTLSSEGSSSSAAGSSKVVAPVGSQKESVFVRLSNRIKALELNMSLSGQYLEELSQRYRKQMDEMQRAFNKTIGTLNDTARKAHERDMKQQEMIGLLQSQITNLSQTVANLVAERDSLHLQVIERHLVLMMAEVILMIALFFLCLRRTLSQLVPLNNRTCTKASASGDSTSQKHPGDRKRRNSVVGTVGHPSLSNKHERRPSEEALNISGTYADLMIVEPVIPIMVDPPVQKPPGESKRKRQRNKRGSRELYRSVSNSILGNQLSQSKSENGPQKRNSTIRLNSAGLLFGLGEAIPEQCPETKSSVIETRTNREVQSSSSQQKQTAAMNGHIKMGASIQNSESRKNIPNGTACKPLNSVSETKKDVFILKRLFHKLYSSNG